MTFPTSVPYSDPNFSGHYLYYAKQIMTRYGDRVPYWVSVNEPNLQPVNNVLTNNLAIPLNTSDESDVAVALRYQDFSLGIMNNPLFLGIQIPDIVLNTNGIPIDSLTDARRLGNTQRNWMSSGMVWSGRCTIGRF